MVGDGVGTLFASLVFGALYLWLVAPAWPPTEIVTPNLWVIAAAGLLAAAALMMRITCGLNRADNAFIPMLAITLILDMAVLGVLSMAVFLLPDPTSHAHAATVAALIGYSWLHAFGDLRLARLWHDYTAVTGVLGMALVLLMPSLIGMLEGVR
mgnify:CR=1 FL=1